MGNNTNDRSSVIHQRKNRFNLVSALSFSESNALIVR